MLSFLFIQCKGNKDKSVPIKNVAGKYIELDAENIHLFVPENIKLFTNDEYAQHINNIKDKKLKRIERARDLELKYGSEDNYYIMGDDDHQTSIMFHAMPYTEIDQSLSQLILQELAREHKALGNVIGYESSFKKAGIIKRGNDRIFRAIFMLRGKDESTGENMQGYSYFYLVNRKGKTFILTFNSGRSNDFDSYVQKIRL